MTTIEFAAEIKMQCAFLENEGYVFHHAANLIRYTNADSVISFNYASYDYIDVYALKASKRFHEIEETLKLKDSHTIYLMFKGADFPDRLTTKDHYHFEIRNAEDVSAWASLIADFYKEKVQPFFETYAAAPAVNDWITATPVPEHHKMISSDGDLMVLRRILMMYHAGDKGYEELLAGYKAYLETELNDSSSKKIYQHLVDMEKTLK